MTIKTAILSVVLFASCQLLAQNKFQVEKLLKKIERFEQIDSLKRAERRMEIFGETISSSDTLNFPFINNPVIGQIYKMTMENRNNQNYLVKVLKKEIQNLCRVQYIFLDGEKLNEEKIDSIRMTIHSRHYIGEKFHNLVKEYNMDGGTGDIGWFSEEMVIPEFFNPILTRRKDEIFNISIPEKKEYYVVKKTEDDVVKNLFYTLWIRYD